MSYANNPHARLAAKKSSMEQIDEKDVTFVELLLEKEVRSKLTEEDPAILEDPETAKGKIRQIMSVSENKPYKSTRDFNRVFNRIVNNLLYYGKLNDYLNSPDVEEINVNGYDNVEVIFSGSQKPVMIHDMFRNADECNVMIKRLARRGDLTLDQSNPLGDSDIDSGTRITPVVTPVTLEDRGAVASIRKQKEKTLTREELINCGTATPDILDFMQMCMNFKITIAFVGPTGSGKTTDMTYFMKNMPKKIRFVCIEEGSREMRLERYDEQGHRCERGVMMKTRPSKDENKMKNIDQTVCSKTALRLDPGRLCMSETRGKEAMALVRACDSGQPVVTTFHTDKPKVAYQRLAMMCQMDETAATIPYEMLLRMCYQAFPIIAFKATMGDGVRRYTAITEAYEDENGKISIIPIFRFVTEKNIYEGEDLVEVKGYFEQVNYISNSLAHKLFENGAELEDIRRFAKPDYSSKYDGDQNGPVEKQKIPIKDDGESFFDVAKAASVKEEPDVPAEPEKQLQGKYEKIAELEKMFGVGDTLKEVEADLKINKLIDKTEEKPPAKPRRTPRKTTK